MATSFVEASCIQIELCESAMGFDESLCIRSHFTDFLPCQAGDRMLAAVHGAARHFLQGAKARVRLKISGPNVERLSEETKRMSESALQASLFGGPNKDGPGSVKFAGRQIVIRDVAWRLTQRLACLCQLGVPFPFPGPGNRGRDPLKVRRLSEPRAIGSRFGQPAVVEKTIQSVGRCAGREQDRHRKLDSKQRSLAFSSVSRAEVFKVRRFTAHNSGLANKDQAARLSRRLMLRQPL
ncbi:MAG: hypothetical protein WBL40_05620 [Terrimicrobiaceae bacterium]